MEKFRGNAFYAVCILFSSGFTLLQTFEINNNITVELGNDDTTETSNGDITLVTLITWERLFSGVHSHVTFYSLFV